MPPKSSLKTSTSGSPQKTSSATKKNGGVLGTPHGAAGGGGAGSSGTTQAGGVHLKFAQEAIDEMMTDSNLENPVTLEHLSVDTVGEWINAEAELRAALARLSSLASLGAILSTECLLLL